MPAPTHPARTASSGSGWTVGILFCLLAIVIPAGGLGMASIAALMGLITIAMAVARLAWGTIATALSQSPVGWTFADKRQRSFISTVLQTLATHIARARSALREHASPVNAAHWPWAVMLWAGLFVWASVTMLWSPYDRADYALKFLIAAPVYLTAVAMISRLAGPGLARAQMALMVGMLGAAALFAAEMLTGNMLSATHSGDNANAGEVMRTLGRGMSAFVALLPGLVVLLWRYERPGRVAAAAMLTIALWGGLAFGLTSNVLGGLGCIGGLALATAISPARAVIIAAAIAAASIAISPLMVLFVWLPDGIRDALPLTWEYRIEIWAYTVREIASAPLFGHGFDASRAIDHIAQVRGRELDLMRMHPHSAGLHVYFEVGAVGALLMSAAILATGRMVAQRYCVNVQRAATGAFLAAASMAAVSYGVWQDWWVATGFLAACAALLTRVATVSSHHDALTVPPNTPPGNKPDHQLDDRPEHRPGRRGETTNDR